MDDGTADEGPTESVDVLRRRLDAAEKRMTWLQNVAFGTAAAVAAGGVLVGLIAPFVVALGEGGGSVGRRTLRLARSAGSLLLVASGMAILIVITLSSDSDGSVEAFSPASTSLAIGGGALILATQLHPDRPKD